MKDVANSEISTTERMGASRKCFRYRHHDKNAREQLSCRISEIGTRLAPLKKHLQRDQKQHHGEGPAQHEFGDVLGPESAEVSANGEAERDQQPSADIHVAGFV